MPDCGYCDLDFDNETVLALHRKTKKCRIHRNIAFTCRTCLTPVLGYENTLRHVAACETKKDATIDSVVELVNRMNLGYNLTVDSSGTLLYDKVNDYLHPLNLHCGATVPQKPYLIAKALAKHDVKDVLGCHNLYMNDMFNKILRLTDTYQLMCLKYDFETSMTMLWSSSTYPTIIRRDDSFYILGKVQAQNTNGDKKWYGETVVKFVWFKDPRLAEFFKCMRPLLGDILNLFLRMADWALKKNKIKLKGDKDHEPIIAKTMEEFNLTNLIDNIKKLNCYDTFYSTVAKILAKEEPAALHTNVQHVFKDESAEPFCIVEESLMNMKVPNEISGNMHHLVLYVLPENEKPIFKAKRTMKEG
jgi:hypothetical protein